MLELSEDHVAGPTTRHEERTHRVLIIFSSCHVFTFRNLASKIFHVNTFLVFRNGPKFLVEPSIFKDAESQHVRRRHYPHVPRVHGVGEVLKQTCQVL